MNPVIGTFYCLEFKRMQRRDPLRPNGFHKWSLAMKNCYPSPRQWTSSEQNASADTLRSRATPILVDRCELIGAKRFDTLFQPLR